MLADKGQHHMSDTQVHFDRPWENPAKRQLSDATVKLTKSVNDLVQTCGKTTKEANKADENDGVSNAWEQQMAEGLAASVDGGKIITVNYKWRHGQHKKAGDLDCLVAGTVSGVPVVIIGEAQLNMVGKVSEALTQLDDNVRRWGELVWMSRLSPTDREQEGANVTEHDLRDIKLLRVESLRGHQVRLAVGGASIPKWTMERIEQHMRTSHSGSYWYPVTMPEGAVSPAKSGYSL